MAEILPNLLAAFDARKRAMTKQLAELLSSKTGSGKLTQMLASVAEDAKKLPAAQQDAMSVMPEVAAAGRQGVMDEGMKVAGMFVGPGAKMNPAELAKYQAAQLAETKGIDPEVIRQATGWGKGADGNWKREISDVGSRMTPQWNRMETFGNTSWPPAGDVMVHPDLFKAYPHLQDIPISKIVGPGSGSYNARSGIEVGAGGSGDLERTVMLHELQHAIQKHEGWAPGGNTSSPEVEKFAFDRTEPLHKSGALSDELALKYYDRQRAEGYKRLAGEVEARNTETRRNMTDAERVATPPLQTQEYPGQIIQQEGSAPGVSASMPTNASQLAAYQQPVYERLLKATGDPQAALEATLKVTNLMQPGTLPPSVLPK